MILVLHGPNLRLLSERDPELYGEISLTTVNNRLQKKADELGLKLKIFQSNHKGKLIDFMHTNRGIGNGLVINPGAFTHYSYAIRDALDLLSFPVVEVHLTDIYDREDFRRESVIEPVVDHQYVGQGIHGYIAGLEWLASKIDLDGDEVQGG